MYVIGYAWRSILRIYRMRRAPRGVYSHAIRTVYNIVRESQRQRMSGLMAVFQVKGVAQPCVFFKICPMRTGGSNAFQKSR